MSNIKKALDAVDAYGHLSYPVGQDRASLCHAANVLAPEVRRLRTLLSELHRVATAKHEALGDARDLIDDADDSLYENLTVERVDGTWDMTAKALALPIPPLPTEKGG